MTSTPLTERLELVAGDAAAEGRKVLALIVEPDVAERLEELGVNDRRRLREWLDNDVELAASLASAS